MVDKAALRFWLIIEKDFVTPKLVGLRYDLVMELNDRDKQQKPLAERMKVGAEQAAKDNTERPEPAKDTKKDRS